MKLCYRQRIQLFFLILAMMSPTLACSNMLFIDNKTNCDEVNGTWNGSTCYTSGDVARGVDGKTYEELDKEDDDQPVTEIEDIDNPPIGIEETAAEDVDSLFGTYIGTSNYPEALTNLFESGQYTRNEVGINLAEDGTISGSYSIYYVGDPFFTVWNDNECTGHWEVDINGTLSGNLTSSSGMITSKEDWVCTDNSDCEDMWDVCSTGDEPVIREFKINVSGNQMTGITVPLSDDDVDGGFVWTFNATKQ